METTKKLNETPLIQQMTDKHTYIIVDDQGNVSRVKDVAKEYVTETELETELNTFIEPYNERITANETDIDSTKTDVLDIESYLDIVTPKNTASGELVHVTDALPLDTFGTKSSGNVEQETTTGKNLFYNQWQEEYTSNGVTNTFNEGVISISGTPTAIWANTTRSFSKTLEIDTYIMSIDKEQEFTVTLKGWYEDDTTFQYTINKGSKTKTFTTTKIIKSYYIFIGDLTIGNEINSKFKVQIEKGSTATEYEPYTGGQASPNPDYPQEIEVLEAYNLFNSFIATKSQYQPVGELQIEKDGTIILSGNAGSNNYFALNQTLGELCPDLKVGDTAYLYLETTSAVKNIYIGEAWIHNNAKTITQTILDKSVVIYGGYNQVDKIKIQVSKEPNKKYVPYNHIGYKVYSENLYENSQDFSGVWSNNAEWLTHDETYNGLIVKKRVRAWTGIYKQLTVEKGKTYTFSVYVKSDSDKNTAIYISGGTATVTQNNKSINTTSSWTRESLTFTATSDGTVSPRLENLATIDGNYTYICGYQLEEGPIVTDYKPYKEQIVYLDLKGNWVGKISDTIKDYLVTDKKKLWLVKNVKKVVFNGNEDWGLQGTYCYKLTINDIKPSNVWADNAPIMVMSNYFKGENWYNLNIYHIPNVIANHNAYNIIYISHGDIINDLDTFKNWLKQQYDNGTPVIAYYALAEPQTIYLGELPEPIKTFEGVNNIQLLANLDTEIEVVYAQDVKKYIDSKLAEISAQII